MTAFPRRRPPLPSVDDETHQAEHDHIKVLVQGFDAYCMPENRNHAARSRAHCAAKHAILCHLVDHHRAQGKDHAYDGLEDMLDAHEEDHRS